MAGNINGAKTCRERKQHERLLKGYIPLNAREERPSVPLPCFDGGRIVLDLPAICFQWPAFAKTIGGPHAPKIQLPCVQEFDTGAVDRPGWITAGSGARARGSSGAQVHLAVANTLEAPCLAHSCGVDPVSLHDLRARGSMNLSLADHRALLGRAISASREIVSLVGKRRPRSVPRVRRSSRSFRTCHLHATHNVF